LKSDKKLHSIGQSLWVDHVNRKQIYNNALTQYIEDGVVSGLLLSPQALCQTIKISSIYDDGIFRKLNKGLYGKSLANDLILEDVHRAADLLRYVFDQTNGVNGWAVLPVSILLTSNPDELLQSVSVLHARLKRKNILISIPGLPDMLEAIEEIVFTGVPVNIALIYSSDQYLQVAKAYLRGIERRIETGLKPAVPGFVSISISHLAAALSTEMEQRAVPEASIAIAKKIYRTMRALHGSLQWERTYNVGARPLRLIWVGPDDESAVALDISNYASLIAPLTVAAISEQAIEAFINNEHPEVLLSADNDDYEEILAVLQKAGFDFKHLTNRLQDDIAARQVNAWILLLDSVARKSATVIQTKSDIMDRGED